jgi:phage terminase large subunit-like protein
MASAAARRVTDRWVRIPSDRHAVEAGCYFDREAADRVCEFFERFLRHSAGQWAAKPFVLQPWQRDYLSRLYGWKKPSGYRRFRETYLEVPKKNGKSTLFAGICLWSVFEEPGAEAYIGASNRKQASIIFDECARMTRASPDLSRALHVVDYTRTITFPRMNAKLVAWTADAAGQDGANASAIVLDEVHRFPNRKLYDVAKYAGRARKQPLLVSITTAGTDRHSLCWQLHQRSINVLNGTDPDPFFLPVIYAADPEVDDLATWRKANPSLGVLFDEESFGNDYREAKRIPGQLNNFLRLSLDIWTEQATRWLALDLWDAGLDPVAPESLKGLPCYAALDLSSVKDLTSLTLVFVLDLVVRVLTFTFMPEETASERAANDGVPYPAWIEAGHMIPTPGNATDFAVIRAKLAELAGIYQVNVAVETDPAGNIKPSKRRSAERIDPVVSMIMAIGLATGEIPPATPSITILTRDP